MSNNGSQTSHSPDWPISPQSRGPGDLSNVQVPSYSRQPMFQTPMNIAAGNSNSDVEGKSGNPFLCNICNRTYSRLDHLARHYRSHTRERPFGCTTCGKNFGRADLLKRHVQSHASGDGPLKSVMGRSDGALLPQPIRVSKACAGCASAKIKCDNDKPCQRCRQANIPCELPVPGNNGSMRSSEDGLPTPVSPVDIERERDCRSSGPHNGLEQLAGVAAGQDSINQALLPNISRLEHAHNGLPMTSSASNMDIPQSSGAFQEGSLSNISEHIERSMGASHNDDLMDLDDSSLAGFLRDIIIPPAFNTFHHPSMAVVQQSNASRDVFDFGIDTSLDFNDSDFDWILNFNSQGQMPPSNFQMRIDNDDSVLTRGQQTPDISSGLNLGAEAFRKSLWRWAPQRRDNGYEEQENLLLSYNELSQLDMNILLEPTEQTLFHASRDQILAMLVSTCSPGTFSRVVSSFPSTQVLNSLIQLHIKTQATSSDSWFHFPSFRPNIARPELNAIIVAAGAVASSIPTLRKLGFAIQEAVRLAIPKAFESDNSLTRDLQLLQAYVLQLSVMVWSGNKRKMEIGESHAQPLITMLRRSGRYRRMKYTPPPPQPEDSEEELQTKWLQWADYESFKRLAFHSLIHDSQVSVAFLVRPLLSYAEVSLELPCSQALWLAPDCKSWRDIYHLPEERLPTLPQCLHDTQPLLKMQHTIDFQMSASIILHAIWSLIAEYRQLEYASKFQSTQNHWNAVLSSWHQELCQLLDHFCMCVSECKAGVSSDIIMFQHLCMMNLHVSFEELQLFAGKEGSEEAHRVYPSLKTWKESRKARHAIWHAGQVVRAARTCHPNQLKGFCAIALYHASLAFWAYGMISMSTSRFDKVSKYSHDGSDVSDPIWLDSLETTETRRFIAVGRGNAAISEYPHGSEQGNSFTGIENPKAVMEIVITILSNGAGDNPVMSPLADNLVRLMQDLRNAAWVIGSS